MRMLLPFAVMALVLASCGKSETVSGKPPEASKKLVVSSPRFRNGQTIPAEFTCDGRDISPQLQWRGVPSQAKEIAILVEDPGAPNGIFVHWTAWGIPPKVRGVGDNPDPNKFSQ